MQLHCPAHGIRSGHNVQSFTIAATPFLLLLQGRHRQDCRCGHGQNHEPGWCIAVGLAAPCQDCDGHCLNPCRTLQLPSIQTNCCVLFVAGLCDGRGLHPGLVGARDAVGGQVHGAGRHVSEVELNTCAKLEAVLIGSVAAAAVPHMQCFAAADLRAAPRPSLPPTIAATRLASCCG